MNGEKSLKDRFLKSGYGQILLVIIGIILVVSVLGLQISGYKKEAFVLVFIPVIVGISIYSAVIYRRGTSEESPKGKLSVVLRIIWNYSIAAAIMLIYYKVSLGKAVMGDRSYWFYNLMAIYLCISYLLKYLIRFLQERKKLIGEKAGLSSHVLNALGLIWYVFFLYAFLSYWLFIPAKTLKLGSAPKPYVIYGYEHENKERDTSVGSTSREIKIEDEDIIESFMSELSKSPVERIRGVEYLCVSGRYESETYYYISPEYKDSKGNAADRPYDFDKMFFSEMTLYENGDLIIENHRLNHKFPRFFNNTEYYKVKLSPELTDRLIGLH